MLVPRAASAPTCDAIEVEYALAANLQLTDTPLGIGDGIHPVGPGAVVLRFENQSGVPASAVEMLAYRMHEQFVIHSKALLWKSDFTSITDTGVTPDACAVVAQEIRSSCVVVQPCPNGAEAQRERSSAGRNGGR